MNTTTVTYTDKGDVLLEKDRNTTQVTSQGNTTSIVLVQDTAQTAVLSTQTTIEVGTATETIIVAPVEQRVEVTSVGLTAIATDHGSLLGLEDDDHPQYLTDERGDAKYPLLGHVHTALDTTYNNADSGIVATDVKGALDELKAEVDPNAGDHTFLQNRDVADQHPISAITGLDAEQTVQDADILANTTVIAAHTADLNNPHQVTYADLPDTPTSLPPGPHDHVAGDITDFDIEVGNHPDVVSNKAHTIDLSNPHQVTYADLPDPPSIPAPQTFLHADLTDVTADQHHSQIHAWDGPDHTGVPSTFPPDAHGHVADDITDFDTEVGNHPDVVANKAHVTSDGSDHGFIDQDVTIGGSPTFVSAFTKGGDGFKDTNTIGNTGAFAAVGSVNFPRVAFLIGDANDVYTNGALWVSPAGANHIRTTLEAITSKKINSATIRIGVQADPSFTKIASASSSGSSGKVPMYIQATGYNGVANLRLEIDGKVAIGKGTAAGAALDVAGSIILTGTVDGRDIAADAAEQTAHIADLNNPHQIEYADLPDKPSIPPPQTFLHANLTDVAPDDHHNQTHLLFGADHTDVEFGAGVAIKQGLFRNVANDKFEPDYRTKLIPFVDGQTYYPQETVYQDGWLTSANTVTTDHPNPTPVGNPYFLYLGASPTEQVVAKQVTFGARYNLTVDAVINGYALNTVSGNRYIVYKVEDPTVNAVITQIADFVSDVTGWREINYVSSLIPAGTPFDLVATVSEPDETTAEWTGDWSYNKPNNASIPTSGQISHANKQTDQLRVHKTDSKGGDRAAELLALLNGDTIQIGAGTNWSIQDVFDAGSYVTLTVAPAAQDTLTGTQTFSVQTIVAVPITRMFDLDWWVTNGGGQAQGLYIADGKYVDIIPDNSAYGVDIHIQEEQMSPDWDIYGSPGGGTSASGGSFTPDLFTGPGSSGYVPDPISSSGKVLTDAGTWGIPADPDGLVPPGGIDKQILHKASNVDHDMIWKYLDADGGFF